MTEKFHPLALIQEKKKKKHAHTKTCIYRQMLTVLSILTDPNWKESKYQLTSK